MTPGIDHVTTRIPLQRPFAISRGTMTETQLVHVRLTLDGKTGWGEGCPSPGVTGETLAETTAALARLEADRLDPTELEASLEAISSLPPAARSAVDLALHDLAGRLEGRPVHDLLGIPVGDDWTAATVTLTDPADARAQAEQWLSRGFLRLKLKVGDPSGVLELIDAVREMLPDETFEWLPEAEIWVDANEALDLASARELLPSMAERGVRLVEQPLPGEDLEGLAKLAAETPIPLVVDEGIQGPGDLATLETIEGPIVVNVKVQKVGGLAPAKATIEAAKHQGRDVLVGCNIESGLGIAAGCHLLGAVDHTDLDGNLFLAQDPFPLARQGPGHATTPEGPGLGVVPDRRFPPGQEAAKKS